MKIFLTGATGFVGHHVARALAAEGADLRLLVRKTSNLANLEGIPGDTQVGDLARPETLRSGAHRLRSRRPRCRRLPSLDSRSRGHVQRQRRRDARLAEAGPRGRRQARRLHLQRRHHALPHATARSSTKTRPSRSKTWSATTSAPNSWPNSRPSPPPRTASRSSSSTPPPPSAPTTASPRPPAASLWTF